MDISEIKNPEFIKTLKTDDLNELAKYIREYIIDVCSKNGGYLSSNLSLVEIVMGMHYVFKAPIDHFIFDTGYQVYTHKILTGRAQGFKTLRRYEGISDYINPKESIYDEHEPFMMGDSLSYALGLAIASDINNDKENVVVLIGDEAIMTANALKSLIDISNYHKKVIIILNDNADYRTKNFGGYSKFFTNLRYSKEYTHLKRNIKDSLNKNEVGKVLVDNFGNFKNSLKSSLAHNGIFTNLNINYQGPINGHDINAVLSALNKAKNEDGPSLIHFMTKKGRGYDFIESGLKIDKGLSLPFDIKTGKDKISTPINYKSTATIIADSIANLIKNDENIMCIALGDPLKNDLYNLISNYGNNVISMGSNVDGAFSFAKGLYKKGKKIIIVLSSIYLLKAMNSFVQYIINDNIDITVCLEDASININEAKYGQGIYDISILNTFKNVRINQASNSLELESLINNSFDKHGPSVIRCSNIDLINSKELVISNNDKWYTYYESDNALMYIISYGNNLRLLKERIMANNLPINITNAISIKPIDEEYLDKIIESKKPVLIYSNDYCQNGLCASIKNYFYENNAKNKLIDLALEDSDIPLGSMMQVRQDKNLDFKHIIEKIKNYD